MSVTVQTPSVDDLAEVLRDLAGWQFQGSPVQLHPGDLGWNCQFGAATLAGELRVWRRDGALVAVGMLDSNVLRLGLSPQINEDESVAARLVEDFTDPQRGVLSAGRASVEVRYGQALREALVAAGWADDEPWTPLVRDLSEPVVQDALRIERVDEANLAERIAVHRASFNRSTFTETRWRAMADCPAWSDARSLLGRDASGAAVAMATVWSAGPGRPGLLEPLGVHHDHRGHGYGRAITLAAAAALQEMGSSSAGVATPSANTAAVAAYVSAGFVSGEPVRDLRRPD